MSRKQGDGGCVCVCVWSGVINYLFLILKSMLIIKSHEIVNIPNLFIRQLDKLHNWKS